MTPAEQSIITALVAAKENAGFIGAVATVVLALLGWLGTRVWSGLGHRIANAQQAAVNAAAAAVKADDLRRADVNALHSKIDGHIERDETMHGEVLKGLRELTGQLGQINTAIARDIGDRPTRAEVRELIRDYKA